jgi:DNA polymerase III sliding clamp (beta) subunit (PCNA family)
VTMTDTATVTTVTVETADLRRILGNVAPFASTDRTVPVLCAVRLEITDGILTGVAGDRFALAYDTCPVDLATESTDTSTLIDLSDAKRIMSILTVPRGMRPWPATLTFETSTLTVHVRFSDSTVKVPVVDGAFPRWRSLLPTEVNTADGITRTAYNPKILAKLAKVTDPDTKRPAARFTFTGTDKPGYVRIGETFRALIMPIRQPV